MSFQQNAVEKMGIDTSGAINCTGNLNVNGGFRINGFTVTSSAGQLNTVNTTAGNVTATKAMIVDSTSSIQGLGTLGVNSLTNLTTITGLSGTDLRLNSTLSNVLVQKNGTTQLEVGSTNTLINNTLKVAGTAATTQLEVGPTDTLVNNTLKVASTAMVGSNTNQGVCLTGNQNSFIDFWGPGGNADYDARIQCTGLEGTAAGKGDLNLWAASVNIGDHDGATTGLRLNGVLVTATAAQLNAAVGNNQSPRLTYHIVTEANYTLTPTQRFLIVDTTANTVQIHFPDLGTGDNLGIQFVIKRYSSNNSCTMAAVQNSGVLIDVATPRGLGVNACETFVWVGASNNWSGKRYVGIARF
jgi:hypothetical protein